MSGETNDTLRPLVERYRAGDQDAVDELLEHSMDRLRRLARKKLRRSPRVRRWEQTDDLLQGAAVRLRRAMLELPPEKRPDTVRRYFGLAALQIRRELIDLARHHFGPEGHAAHHASDPGLADSAGGPAPLHDQAGGDPTAGPATLAELTEFHRIIESLPEDEREVFDMLYYHDLTRADAAELLGVSVRTVKRRWRDAKLALGEKIKGGEP